MWCQNVYINRCTTFKFLKRTQTNTPLLYEKDNYILYLSCDMTLLLNIIVTGIHIRVPGALFRRSVFKLRQLSSVFV